MPPQKISISVTNEFIPSANGSAQKEIIVTDEIEDLRVVARRIVEERADKDDAAAFNLVSLDVITQQYELWRSELPNVEMHYAVKCNNDAVMLRTLARLGAGFDCASTAEIETALSVGVSPDRIIFAHPCKSPAAILHADKVGVRLATFDSIEEFEKIESLGVQTDLLLRINVSDETAILRLADKFGAELEKAAPAIILEASAKKSSRILVRGISFHIGYGVRNSLVFREALGVARHLFDLAAAAGAPMDIVDIGGGYPGDDNDRFREMASVIRSALADFFPPSTGVRILGEPGQFVANQAVAVVANVIAAMECSAADVIGPEAHQSSCGFKYFINDGAFCSFSKLIWGDEPVCGELLREVDEDELLFPTRIWGPTATSKDVVEKCCQKPRLAVGDWLFYSKMGAYSTVLATPFNSFSQGRPAYVVARSNWDRIHH